MFSKGDVIIMITLLKYHIKTIQLILHCLYFQAADATTTSRPTTSTDYLWNNDADVDVRLVGGSTDREGRVEIYRNGVWGTVCDNYWDVYEARVVCRQLGFSSDNAEAFSGAHFGRGLGTIHFDYVSCTGSESKLGSCSSNGWDYNSNCGHSQDVSVRCGRSNAPNNLIEVKYQCKLLLQHLLTIRKLLVVVIVLLLLPAFFFFFFSFFFFFFFFFPSSSSSSSSRILLFLILILLA